MSNARNLANLKPSTAGLIENNDLGTGVVAEANLATSAVTSDKISNSSVTSDKLAATLDLSAKTLTLPSGVGGKVLQIVSSTLSTKVTSSSTAFVTSGLALNITPTLSNSKVLVMVMGGAAKGGSTSIVVGTIYRNSTNLGDANFGLEMVRGGETLAPHSMAVLDSPSSTAQQTYTTYFRTTSSTVSFNDIAGCGTTMLAVEIAP